VGRRRRLYKADSVGDAYIVVCLGGADGGPPPAAGRHELLALALALARAAADADGGGGDGGLRVRVGVAEGDVVAGLTGAHRQRYVFFGAAVARAEGLQRRAQPGEILVQASVAAAAAAARDGFIFFPCGREGDAGDAGVEEGGADLVLVRGPGDWKP
jgi:class 3 adenylate cyclase